MKNSIGTFEAKTKFAELIQRAAKGEEILITKRGQPVAKIVPLEKNPNLASTKAAIARLRLLAKEMKLGQFNWDDWKTYRDIGKK